MCLAPFQTSLCQAPRYIRVRDIFVYIVSWNRLNFYTLLNKSRNRFKSGSPTNMHHMEPILLETGKRKSQQKLYYLFLASKKCIFEVCKEPLKYLRTYGLDGPQMSNPLIGQSTCKTAIWNREIVPRLKLRRIGKEKNWREGCLP